MQLTKSENEYVLFIFDDGEKYDRSDLLDAGWIAEIISCGGPYTFERKFLNNHKGGKWYGLEEGKLYEYRDLYEGGSKYGHTKYGGASGFFRIIGGTIEALDKQEAIALLKQPDAAMLAALESNKEATKKRQEERRLEKLNEIARQLKDLGFVYIATVMMSKLSIITTLEEERALAAKWAKAKVNDTLQA